jgi:SOS-response transcriptional repressor LexA
MDITLEEQINLRARLKSEMNARGIVNQKEFAKLLGVSPQYVGQLFKGERMGSRKVWQFAKALNRSVEWLLGRIIGIPLIAEVGAGEHFNILEHKVLEEIDISDIPGIDKNKALDYYAIKIKDNSFYPTFNKGDILIVEKRQSTEIKHGSRVVWFQEKEKSLLKFVEIHLDHLLIRCFNQTIPSISRPLSELKNMHKVKAVLTA